MMQSHNQIPPVDGSYSDYEPHAELERWLEVELDLETLLSKEASLAAAYLRADVRQAKGYWEEVAGGLQLWELRLGYWLLSAAPPSWRQWSGFNTSLPHSVQSLQSGEVLEAERAKCMTCGEIVCRQAPLYLHNCHGCGAGWFIAATPRDHSRAH